jgi:glycosyltransferase involved in cell wall biosynthesis
MRRPRVRVSGAVIAQDNEDTIEAVLDNLGQVCDEIVVVDGGSHDATRERAASRPDVRLYERPCGDDIGAQKNFAFDQCFGDWILVLDTDELLGARGLRRLRFLTQVPGMRWFSFPRYWLVEQDGRVGYLAGKPYYRDRQIRLFRNEPGFRYDASRQPIHHPFRGKHGMGRPLRRPHVFHYALLLLDRAAREEKVRRYARAEPGSEALHAMGLWEESGVPVAALPEPCPDILRGGARGT